MRKVLLIDDDVDLGRLLSEYLAAEGFECRCLQNGRAGLDAALDPSAEDELIILDVMLPGLNGFEVLSTLRGRGVETPVIMLTAKGDEVDRIVGLEMGADDYLPKPFNPRELLARMRAALRRTGPASGRTLPESEGRLTHDEFELDERSYQAAFQGRALALTPVEFKLLWTLLKTPGRVVSRDTLFREALGRRENLFDRSLDMHVSRLRKKLATVIDAAERIRSIRGEGYLYVSAPGEHS